MHRPSIDEYFMSMLQVVASRATCARRRVGAIVTDGKYLLASGYNGVPSGVSHCIEVPCPGASGKPGDNTKCMAIHAETNALLQCGDRLREATTLYCTCSPCFNCAKLIATTKIKRVIVGQVYADTTGLDLLRAVGISLELFTRVENGYVLEVIY